MMHSALTPLFATPLVGAVLLVGARLVSAPEVQAPATSAPTPAGAQKARLAESIPTAKVPPLYIEGQPFVVELGFAVPRGDAHAEIPAYLLGPSAWLLDGKPLLRREGDAKIRLEPGQTLASTLDVAPLIEARLEGDNRDFRFHYSEGARAVGDVIHLALPEAGIRFMELPKEQLSNYQVVLDTSGGLIWLELWPDVAPNHVRNFLDLCSTGYYDGVPFHRVMPGFMIQGGRAKDGKPIRTVDAEFSNRPHEAGVLSAARLSTDINSASSEFFIVHQASRQLDGKYSAFGRVIVGMAAVEKIVRGAEMNVQLIDALQRNGIEIDRIRFDHVINDPNPPQLIRQALVVKASKSRPVKDGAADGRR